MNVKKDQLNADEWQEQLDAGEVRLMEPDNDDDDIADEDNEEED